MADIVERLHEPGRGMTEHEAGNYITMQRNLLANNAVEIERLRAALNEVISSLETLGIDGWSEAPHLMSVCRAALTTGKSND